MEDLELTIRYELKHNERIRILEVKRKLEDISPSPTSSHSTSTSFSPSLSPDPSHSHSPSPAPSQSPSSAPSHSPSPALSPAPSRASSHSPSYSHSPSPSPSLNPASTSPSHIPSSPSLSPRSVSRHPSPHNEKHEHLRQKLLAVRYALRWFLFVRRADQRRNVGTIIAGHFQHAVLERAVLLWRKGVNEYGRCIYANVWLNRYDDAFARRRFKSVLVTLREIDSILADPAERKNSSSRAYQGLKQSRRAHMDFARRWVLHLYGIRFFRLCGGEVGEKALVHMYRDSDLYVDAIDQTFAWARRARRRLAARKLGIRYVLRFCDNN